MIRSSRRLGRGLMGVALPLAIALATGGCNPFLPSQPETPGAAGSTVAVDIDFTSTEGLLSTLSQAVANKNQGNAFRAYMAAFADTTTQGLGLRIDVDPEVVIDFANAGKPHPTPLSRQDEADFYNYLVTLDPGDYDLSFEPGDPDVNDAPDHAILHRTYILSATNPSDGTVTQLATGKAELELRRLPAPSTNWVIVRWTDSILSPDIGPNPADTGLYCFSRLRLDSYNRLH